MKVWFITGCSSGFGKELALAAAAAGHPVVATARRLETLTYLQPYEHTALRLPLDITDAAAVQAAVQAAVERFGRIDVLVNNAGYGLSGALEEATDEQIRQQFDTNVFGTLAVTRAILPLMRQQRSGYIMAISSIAGLVASAGFGLYNGSKFALEGIFEALAQEVSAFGIRVTIVEPGPFRTEFAGGSLLTATPLPDYDATAVGRMRQYFEKVNGKQEGDPVKAAQILLSLPTHPQPPLRLLLGGMTLNRYLTRLRQEQQRVEDWQDTTRSVDYTA